MVVDERRKRVREEESSLPRYISHWREKLQIRVVSLRVNLC